MDFLRISNRRNTSIVLIFSRESSFSSYKAFWKTPKDIFVIVTRKFHDEVFDGIWVRNLAKYEVFFFAGRLDGDIAVVHDGWNEAVDFSRNVLYTSKVEFAYASHEQSFLLDIHDTFSRDDPNIEIVIDPNKEAEKPNENEERILYEEEEAQSIRVYGIREECRHGEYAADKKKRCKEYDDKMRGNIEPMTMDDADNVFIFMLSFESILIWHNASLKPGIFRNKSVYGQRKEYDSVWNKQYAEYDDEERCSENHRYSIYGVADNVIENEERRNDVSEKKNCV